MGWKFFTVFAVIATSIVAVLFLVPRPNHHRITVTSYFSNVAGLHELAPVRIAGVTVGIVKSIRVQTEIKPTPVEVIMALDTPYEIKIPNDSVASLETEGVLGQTFVDIETASASGPPIGNNAVLRSVPRPESMTADEVVKKFGEIVDKANCSGSTKGSKASKSQGNSLSGKAAHQTK